MVRSVKPQPIDQWQQEVLDSITPTTKIYTTVTKVNRMGTARWIKVYMVKDGDIFNLTPIVGNLLEYNRTDDGLHVTGCGMDMCWHLVYTLSRTLFKGDKNPTHGDPGYILQQRNL